MSLGDASTAPDNGMFQTKAQMNASSVLASLLGGNCLVP